MKHSQLDAVIRQAGSIDRKRSLKVLGASLVAAVAARPLHSDAKAGKPCREHCDKSCGKLEKACKKYWNGECQTQNCRDFLHGCCAHLGTCRGAQYFTCTSTIVMQV